MTIQEAIKSGKPFKRKGWRNWYKFSGGASCRQFELDGAEAFISFDNFVADDWEVKQEPVTFEAYLHSMSGPTSNQYNDIVRNKTELVFNDGSIFDKLGHVCGRRTRVTIEVIE